MGESAVTSSKLGLGILGLIVLAIGGWLWWDRTNTTTLDVVGEATVTAAPDEYIFSPTYQEEHADQTVARTKVTETGNAVVGKLKELGVTESQLETSVMVNENYDYRLVPDGSKPSGYLATYSVTITLAELELAKKVQEYLSTTPLTGLTTPTSTFADATRKELERQARKLALDDAKRQAEDTADSLGVSIRGIESIGQPSWGGPVYPLGVELDRAVSATAAAPEFASPELLVGEQEVTYQIQVVYRVR